MTLFELEDKLNKLKLTYRNYSLTREYLEDGFCLSKSDNFWNVYYCERGTKNIIGTFLNESDACEYMFCKFKKKSDESRLF